MKGFFMGGIVGASVAAALTTFKKPSDAVRGEEDDVRGGGVNWSAYKHINLDGGLLAILQEPASLFWSLDQTACSAMLDSYDELARIYMSCRQGESRPTVVSDALAAKRSASNHLLALNKKARQKKPMAASEILQDVEALKKSLQDYVYNIDQEQALQQRSNFF